MQTLPAITNKQQDILRLVYRYRFLNRLQVQAFLGHTDKRRSSRWLKDLKEKDYLAWIYDNSSLSSKTTPAIYYLSLNGVRWLREHEEYAPEELRKRYRESSRQSDFIARSLLLADCCLHLKQKSSPAKRYSFVKEVDYMQPTNRYYFLAELQPQLCFVKQTLRSKSAYLLEVFDPTTPRYMVRKRLRTYVDYLSEGTWEAETGDDEPPIVLVACPNIDELAYAKRLTRKLLDPYIDYDEVTSDEDKPYHVRFATTAQVKRQGVTAPIWEEP